MAARPFSTRTLGVHVRQLEPMNLQLADLQLAAGVDALQRREVDWRVFLLGGRLRLFFLRRGFGRRSGGVAREIAIEVQPVDAGFEVIGLGSGEFRLDGGLVQLRGDVTAQNPALELVLAVGGELDLERRRLSLRHHGELELALGVLRDATGLQLEILDGVFLAGELVDVRDRSLLHADRGNIEHQGLTALGRLRRFLGLDFLLVAALHEVGEVVTPVLAFHDARLHT